MTSPALSSIARGVPDIDLLRALAATNRPALEHFIAAAIDILDAIDGDPDIEEDDPTGQADEDGVNTVIPINLLNRRTIAGAGCLLSDDDGDETYRPLMATADGRAFANARRARLGLSPVCRR